MEIKDMVHASKQKIAVMQEGIRLAEAIREFTEEMAEKVSAHIGDRDGWDDDENASDMYDSLKHALMEGDYVSVANYAMFLNGLGYKPGRSSD